MSTILLVISLAWTCILPVPGPRNLPPVAIDDEVMVTGYTDYLEIPVFGNDYDPEGQTIEVTGLGSVDMGKAVLLEGGAVGITPQYPWNIDDGSHKPVVIAHGVYIISDGQLSSQGQWIVWYQPSQTDADPATDG